MMEMPDWCKGKVSSLGRARIAAERAFARVRNGLSKAEYDETLWKKEGKVRDAISRAASHGHIIVAVKRHAEMQPLTQLNEQTIDRDSPCGYRQPNAQKGRGKVKGALCPRILLLGIAGFGCNGHASETKAVLSSPSATA